METLLQWQLDIIRAVQLYSNQPLTALMRIITAFGSSLVYVILLPLVYWCLDEKKGIRLGLAVMFSVWINIVLKLLLDQPRPFFEGYDPSLGMIPERMGGFPSGHAQNSLVLWIIIASWGKKKWLYGAAALGCLLVGFSRVYLGVHFPTDVLGGWILGGIVLCVYFILGSLLRFGANNKENAQFCAFSTLQTPLGAPKLGFLHHLKSKNPQVQQAPDRRVEEVLVRGGFRAEMIAAAASAFIMILYRPSAEAIMPGGMLLGMAAGYSLNKRYIGFKSSAVFEKTGTAKFVFLLLRFVSGIAVIGLIFLAFEMLTAKNQFSDYYLLLYFSRFALIGLWAYAGAPRLFGFLRLAELKTGNR